MRLRFPVLATLITVAVAFVIVPILAQYRPFEPAWNRNTIQSVQITASC